ncbi:hypothetical protein ACH4OY_25760, partial [Micromonospora rubida]
LLTSAVMLASARADLKSTSQSEMLTHRSMSRSSSVAGEPGKRHRCIGQYRISHAFGGMVTELREGGVDGLMLAWSR